jgi:hypothetical protein
VGSIHPSLGRTRSRRSQRTLPAEPYNQEAYNVKKTSLIILSGALAALALAGCGKQNPVAPQSSTQTPGTKTIQQYKPAGVIYEGRFAGTGTIKPWNWIDAQDDPSYNARIYTNANYQSANIIRVNGNTWGKVSTFPIAYANTTNATVKVRIFVPSHSSSVTWKIVIQENGGQWRNWVLQNSTGYTGYRDYDFSAILAAVNAGSKSFCINLVVEGALSQYIEVAELYVYVASAAPDPQDPYWYETFSPILAASGTPPVGSTKPPIRASMRSLKTPWRTRVILQETLPWAAK